MIFDRKKFFAAYKAQIGPTSQVEVANLTQILDHAQNHERMTSIRQLAYMIATARWETRRFERMREMGSRQYLSQYDGKGGNHKGSDDYYNFRGGGWCHITFRDNYRKATKWCRTAGIDVDLEAAPERILEPDANYEVMITGHLTGGFTGFKLDTYVNDNLTDYKRARLVINPGELYIAEGKWKATAKRKQQCIEAVDTIVKWAKGCEAALRSAEIVAEAEPPAVIDAPSETFEPKAPVEAAVSPQFLETAKEKVGVLAKSGLSSLTVSSVLGWFVQNKWVTAVIFALMSVILAAIFRKTLKGVVLKGAALMRGGL